MTMRANNSSGKPERWEAYGDLFQAVQIGRKWSRDKLVDELNEDARINGNLKCTYSRRSLDYWEAKPKAGKRLREIRDNRVKHLFDFLTKHLTDLGELEKFRTKLKVIAPLNLTTRILESPSEINDRIALNNLSAPSSTSQKTARPLSYTDSIEQSFKEMADHIERYASTVCSRYGKVPLEFIDPTGINYQALSLTRLYIPQNVRPIQDILPFVLEKTTGEYRPHENGEGKNSIHKNSNVDTAHHRYNSRPSQNVLEVISDANNPKLVLLGALGSGKSSAIQFFAVRWAEARKRGEQHLIFPIIIELRSYAQARRNDREVHDFIDFICRGSGSIWRFTEDFFKRLITTGNAVVFFDGLDEILDSALYEEIGNSIVRFANEFPNVKIVVTSRLTGYRESGLRRADFKHFIFEEFDDQQITQFISNWHREVHANETPPMLDKFVNASEQFVFHSDSLHEIARSPLFLTVMLVLGNEENKPKSHTEVIEQCSNMVLDRWKVDDALRADANLAQDATAIGIIEKKMLLRNIAGFMTTGNDYPTNLISTEDLETVIADSIGGIVRANPLSVARAIIRQMRERNGVLRLDSTRNYSFAHSVFMDFYCAHNLKYCDASGTIDEGVFVQKFLGPRVAHFIGWDGVLRFYCGMVKPVVAGKLLTHIFNLPKKASDETDRVLVIAECLREIQEKQQVDNRLIIQLRSALLDRAFQRKRRESRQSNKNEEGDWAKARRAIQHLGALYGEDKIVADRLFYLLFTTKTLGETVIDALMQGWKKYPCFRSVLQQCIEKRYFELYNYYLIKSLATQWPDSETLNFLKAQCSKCGDYLTRGSAVNVIAKTWYPDQAILKWLNDLFNSSKCFEIKARSVEAIAKYTNIDAKVFPWLTRIALTYKHAEIRRMVVFGISDNCINQSDAINLLCKMARTDKDSSVRDAAICSLVHFHSDKEAVQSLCAIVLMEDANIDVRGSALYGVGEAWKADKKNFEIIQSLTKTESKHIARNAYEILKEKWSSDSETLKIYNYLKKRWSFDEDASFAPPN